MSLGESLDGNSNEPEVKLTLVEGIVIKNIELHRGDTRYFMDIVDVAKDALGKLRGRVSVVSEWADEHEELHAVELPEEIVFTPGDVLNPDDEADVPEGRRAVKIAAIAGIAGSLTLTAAGTAFWAIRQRNK